MPRRTKVITFSLLPEMAERSQRRLSLGQSQTASSADR